MKLYEINIMRQLSVHNLVRIFNFQKSLKKVDSFLKLMYSHYCILALSETEPFNSQSDAVSR